MRVHILFCCAATLLATPSGNALATKVDHHPPRIFRDCRGCPQMVVIPGGAFLMGTPVGEAEGLDDQIERPVHRVTVPSFAAGRFDVTRDEWAAFARVTHRPVRKGCEYTGRPGPFVDPKGSWFDPGFPQTGHDPVVCVTWYDGKDYARWLSKRTGKHYRLLTEAEWEYAARAGTTTPYYWGTRADHSHANYGPDKGYGKGLAEGHDRWVYTSPGGAFPPNRFGLYDMLGNSLQYLEDCLALSYKDTPRDGSAYLRNEPLKASGHLTPLNGKQSCSFRISRGGDWGDPPDVIRSSMRNFGPGPGGLLQNDRSAGVTFRVARDLSR